MSQLKELQLLVHQIRQKRGFTMEPLHIFTLLNEEVGEVARELKKTWSKNYNRFCKEKLAEEMADVFVCLMALANQYEIDLDEAVQSKFILKDSLRQWQSAKMKDVEKISAE